MNVPLLRPRTTDGPDTRRTRGRPWVPLVVVFALAVAACGSGDGDGQGTAPSASDTLGEEGPPVDGGSLVVGVDQETSGWNPNIDRWAQTGALVGSSVLEPLAILDAEAVAQPYLASAWEPNEDHDSWTVTLREGVTFHDGTPFDAEAVKRNIDAALASPLAGVALDGLFDEVTVMDVHTVRVDLLVRWAAFPSSFLAGQSALMKAPSMLESENAGSDHPIGTGPFMFESWVRDTSFRAVRYGDYWREDLPHIEELEFRVIPDNAARAAALEAGDVDMIFTTDARAAADLDAEFTVLKNWSTEPAMLMTNVRPEVDGEPNPMASEHARLALVYATDRESLAATVGTGVDSPTSPFAPENPWGAPADENGYPEYDPDRARDEIEAYLDESGEDALRVTIASEPEVNTLRVLQEVQQQWEAVGIEAEIETAEASTFITDVVLGKYQLAMFRIYSSPDPDQNYFFWGSATAKAEGEISINFAGYTTPGMDDALTRGRENPEFDERYAAYQEHVHAINGAGVNIGLYWVPYTLIAAPRVHGLASASSIEFGNFQPKSWLGELWVE
jgi:peptide/nickel transport system substrate-binding protein